VSVFGRADFDGHEFVLFASDERSGLKAILAVHDTRRGPAIGGCRVWPYVNEDAALSDALRLARGMSYKAAAADVPFGGGKVVVMLDVAHGKTPAMMRSLGNVIEGLKGRYITGEDVGTTAEDMAEIRGVTSFVMGTPPELGGSGDPSGNTALGCFEGIRACLHHRGIESVAGRTIAVQGVGNVGLRLSRLLRDAGARLIISDADRGRAERCAEELDALIVAPDAIYDVEADVFAPCALGAILDANTLPRINASIVAGAANNQLATAEAGEWLMKRRILYAPDYIINAGGMIQLAGERCGWSQAEVEGRVRGIHDTLLRVFAVAQRDRIPTSVAADEFANQRRQVGSAIEQA
jgi:leucine dehydrogenase